MKARIGYFEDFKSADTLLVESDADGLKNLAEIFRSLAAGTTETLAVHELFYVEVHHDVQLRAILGARDLGIRRPGLVNFFLWERSVEGWKEAAEKLEVLVQHGQGHQYLDAEDDQVVVQVSRSEYGDGWWAQHG